MDEYPITLPRGIPRWESTVINAHAKQAGSLDRQSSARARLNHDQHVSWEQGNARNDRALFPSAPVCGPFLVEGCSLEYPPAREMHPRNYAGGSVVWR